MLMFVMSGYGISPADTLWTREVASNRLQKLCLRDVQEGEIEPSKREFLRGWIKKGVIETNTVVSLLCGWLSVTNTPNGTTALALASFSADMLVDFPSMETRVTMLSALSNKAETVRWAILSSLIRMDPGVNVDEDVECVVSDRKQFCSGDRFNIYEEYIQKVNGMIERSNSLQQAITVVGRWFEKESDDGPKIVLDKFLGVYCSIHRVSQRRKDWLKGLETSTVVPYKSYAQQMAGTNNPSIFVEPPIVMEVFRYP
jgi:hypothetical protein